MLRRVAIDDKNFETEPEASATTNLPQVVYSLGREVA